MRHLRRIIPLLSLFILFACATEPPRWRNEAILSLERARKGGANTYFPAEFTSAAQAFSIAEELLKARETDEAERYYSLSLLKSELLVKESQAEQARRREAAAAAERRKKEEEALRAEEEARRIAAEEELRLKQAEQEAAAEARKPLPNKPQKEQHPLVNAYTVRRGETLPFIASRPEVYGDRNLWPLIYRANRDQIRDPRHIWPGQVFRIPRNIGRDEIGEARRYALEKPLR